MPLTYGNHLLRRARVAIPWNGVLGVLALVAILAWLLVPPPRLLDKADHVTYAVCHRLPERTFAIGGRPLPLCARCSGTYLGALAGVLVLVWRGRGFSSELPPRRYLVLLAAFLGIWAVDGLNSFLTFFPELPHLYEPRNIFRLAAGTLEGLAIAVIALPVFNTVLWAEPRPLASLDRWQDLIWMLAGGTLVAGLVSSELPLLLYPLALLSGLAVIMFLGGINTMVVLLVARREGQADRWQQTRTPLVLGVALALVELSAIAVARAAFEAWLA